MRQAHEQEIAATIALIALGGNLATKTGTPEVTLQLAVAQIEAEIAPVMAVSRFYRTPCFPAGAGPAYVNAALAVTTALPAPEILRRLHIIESRHGRERVQRWGMRTLDLDLIALGDVVLPDAGIHTAWRALPPDLQKMRAPDTLILPHPRMQDRAFVLVPLADVAPDWTHPVLGLTVMQMLSALPQADLTEVVPLA